MQNSEAIQAWIQGKMATFRILILASKTEIRSRELSILSWKTRSDQGNSRSRLDTRDWRIFFLGLVSKHEIKCQKFSVSSRITRLSRRNFHSRLEIEKMTLADIWYEPKQGKSSSYNFQDDGHLSVCPVVHVSSQEGSIPTSKIAKNRWLGVKTVKVRVL